jgi:hypothetical protein
MLGWILQITVLIMSMSSTYFLAKKGKERWGYLIGFLAIPFWAATEAYYQEWIWFSTNIYYLITWYLGLKRHWNENKKLG